MVKEITLWEKNIPVYDAAADTPNRMTAYLVETVRPMPAVVIFPGGGYEGRAYHEGEPVAQFYNTWGFQAFVVHYRVAPNRHPAPLADAKRAIRLVRANAAKWGVDPEKVFTCGFSAGGHLTACTAVFDDPAGVEDDLAHISAKPTGAILSYPVIAANSQEGHPGSYENLLGDACTVEACAALEPHKHVDEKTSPCFLWHTADDGSVPVASSLLMGLALREKKIPFEMHIFPKGAHGLGLATPGTQQETPGVERWAALSAAWIHTF